MSIFIFIALMGLTCILFGGWLVVTIVKGIAGLVGSLFASSSCICPTCRQANPKWARFCRRCGHPRQGAIRY
ncbi:MAG TPA: hypothetical protein VL992_16555 [Tepidisphaeraceae bacterium]|nr:hypothetical protein [Tepidisphaeraceae bacterium]